MTDKTTPKDEKKPQAEVKAKEKEKPSTEEKSGAQAKRSPHDQPNRAGTTAMIEAIERGSVFLVNGLYKKGASVNAPSVELSPLMKRVYRVPYAPGSTPLHVACFHGHHLIADFLLERGAKINAKNQEGRTPLDEALRSYEYYLDRAVRREGSRLTPKFAAVKARAQADEYRRMIVSLIKEGAVTGVFPLPEEFKSVVVNKKIFQGAPSVGSDSKTVPKPGS